MGIFSSLWSRIFPTPSITESAPTNNTADAESLRQRHRRNGKWVHTWYPMGDADPFVKCIYCYIGPIQYRTVVNGGLGECFPDQ